MCRICTHTDRILNYMGYPHGILTRDIYMYRTYTCRILKYMGYPHRILTKNVHLYRICTHRILTFIGCPHGIQNWGYSQGMLTCIGYAHIEYSNIWDVHMGYSQEILTCMGYTHVVWEYRKFSFSKAYN